MIKMYFLYLFLLSKFWSMEFFFTYMLTSWMMIFFLSTENMSLFMMILTLFFMNFLLMNFKMNKFIILMIYFSTLNLFYSNNMMEIFILFEFSLIPLILLINSYGDSFKRMSASWMMFFYTFLSSIPFVIFFLMYSKSLFFFNIVNCKFINKWMSMMISLMLMVKMPLFMFHFWLPKAHVESPYYGSMILAGLILKVGGFLFLKFSKLILFSFMSEMIFWTSFIGCLYSSMNCFLELDQKILIAYSSISHMSMMMMSYSMFSKMTIFSMTMFMISHALISSSMFFGLNFIYEKTKTKNFLIFKSAINSSKKFYMISFLILISNFGTPPFLSFFSEFISCFLIIQKNKYMTFIMFLLMSMMYAYNLNLFLNFSLGNNKKKTIFKMNFLNKNMMLIFLFNLMLSLYFFLSIY